MKRIAHIVILALCLALSLQGLALGALGETDEYEVYMAWVSSYGFSGQYEPRPYWTVYFNDGTFYHDLPLEGLYDFNKTKSRLEEPEYWGVYEIDGTKVTWERADYGESSANIDDKGNIIVMGDTYRKLQSVDGMRLHGSWTYYANPRDAWDHPGDDKPVITFSRDGRFIDAGLFKADYLPIPEYYDEDGPDVDEADVAPGRGRYEIVDFTLILTYEDGRT